MLATMRRPDRDAWIGLDRATVLILPPTPGLASGSNPSRLTDLVLRRAAEPYQGNTGNPSSKFDTPCQLVIEINTHALSPSLLDNAPHLALAMLIVKCTGGAKQGKHGLSCLRPTGMYVLAWLRTEPAICPSWGRCELRCSCCGVPGSPTTADPPGSRSNPGVTVSRN